MLNLCSYTILTVLIGKYRFIDCTTLKIVDLLATSGDLSVTWTSPVLPKLSSRDLSINPLGRPITSDEESWIGSLINIGAIIAPLPFGIISEKFGRKVALLTIAVPSIISLLMLAFAKTIILYYTGRLLAGLTLGGGCALLPVYISEISDDANRGMLSVSLNVFWTFGNLLPYLLGPFLNILWFNIILVTIPSTFFILFLITGMESPYFLLAKSRETEAFICLTKLRDGDKNKVKEEIIRIKSSFSNENSGSIKEIFSTRANVKALALSLILIAFQQLSGINVILFYTELIFQETGTDIPAYISSIIIGLFLFLSSLITPVFANKLGRKFFLMSSAIGTMISLALFGSYFYIKETLESDVSIYWLPVVSLVLFIISFNFGVGSLPWTISSELLPASIKSLGGSLVAFTCWTLSFIVTKFFNDLNMVLGKAGTFWIFSGCCLLNFLFTWIFVPETRGKSFAEIQAILQK